MIQSKIASPDSHSRTIALLMRNDGLESALSYIMTLLRAEIPVERILCSMGIEGEFLNMEVASVELFEEPQAGQVQRVPLYGREVRMEAVPIPIFFVETAQSPLAIPVNPRRTRINYLNMLALPLISHGSRTLYISAMSVTPHVFCVEHAHLLYRLCQDIVPELMNLFFPTLPPAPTPSRKRLESMDLMKMCGGLAHVLHMVEKVAPLESTVLITGETGVGKDVVASTLHALSKRNSGPLVRVNCGAIPESLVDSELFGHEKGAFTGAVTTRPGYFEQASGGTIFLDEIGELPLSAQVRLLHVLERREIQRVGCARSIPVDVRILAATHRDLASMVREGKFREDLWFRLTVFPIHIPPLRKRRMDIATLIRYFIATKARELDIENVSVDEKQIQHLCEYRWAGNVRELEHVVERALIMAKSGKNASALQFQYTGAGPYTEDSSPLPPGLDQEATLPSLDAISRRYIQYVLDKTCGKIYGEDGAARILGLHPNTLRSRMGALGLPTSGLRKRS